MHLGKNILTIIIISGFFYSSSIAMSSWHIRSAEMERQTAPAPSSSVIEVPRIIRNPLSLKMLAALRLVINYNQESKPHIPEDVVKYLQFIRRNFHLTNQGVLMQYQALNDAILNNMNYTIPDVILFGRNNANVTFLNNTDLPEERTPLLFAIEKEDFNLARLLLEAGADPNTRWHVSTQTPLIMAVKKGNAALVELLIKHKADIEQPNRIDGSTPLMEAAAWGKEVIVRILLKYGAKKNTASKDGYCAASFAKNHGYEAVYELVVTPEYKAHVASVKNILGIS